MADKTFTQMSDADIWVDLMATEMKAEIVKKSPLYEALRRQVSEPWCCARMWRTSNHIQFQDGTRLRVHFCPRCGREL